MSFTLTTSAQLASTKIQKTPNIILEIENLDNLFALVEDRKILRFDDGYLFDTSGLFFDTKAINKDTLPWIMSKGTTSNFTQQLNQDKGGTGSIPSINIALVDKDARASKLINAEQILGRRANIYLSFAELEHPVDSIRILSGVVSDFSTLAGEVRLKIDNADILKRQEVFIKYTSKLTAPINDSVTSIPVETTSGFIPKKGQVDSLIRIGDELINVVIVGSETSFNTVSRGALGTTATSHNVDDEVTSVYRFYGNPLDIALWLMMSGQTLEPYFETEIISIVEGPDADIQNAVYVDVFNIADTKGVVSGSFATLSGTTSKDGEYPVLSTGITTSNTSYIVLGDVTLEASDFIAGSTISFTTQFSKYNDGCKMRPDEVDIAEHQRIQNLFGSQFPDMEFLIDDTINAKEFIETQLYFPIGAYFLPRKGRASLGITAPALANETTPTLNETNIDDPLSIEPKRSVNNNFYNQVIYDYGKNLIFDKYLARTATISSDSLDQIRMGNRVFTVESDGLKNDAPTANFIDVTSRRLLDRYKFGATYLTIKTQYGIGFAIEVGDVVIFDGRKLQVFDDITNRRDTFNRLMEVTNKTMDVVRGTVSLTLLDTSYRLNGRYATIAPASVIEGGSTTRIKIKPSQGLSIFDQEYQKWIRYIGQPVQIRSDDYTFKENTTLLGYDTTDSNYLLIGAISTPPTNGYIIELPNYDDSSDFNKRLHASYSPTVAVVSGSDDFTFDVNSSDVAKFFVGAIITVSNEDYSDLSPEVTITDITGDTITVSPSLTFTPDSSHNVNRIGFSSDGGNAYLYY